MKKILYIIDEKLGHRLNPNNHVVIKRKYSRENIYTNKFGWRIGDKDERYLKKKFTFFGCSWAMGLGNEYRKSILGHLEKILNIKLNNLGVGGYSLLQIILFIEKNIEQIKDSQIYIFFGSWQVDRCIKDQATPITYRPILIRNIKNKKIVLRPPHNPPLFLVSLYFKINNYKNIFRLPLLYLILKISMVFHGNLRRYFEKILYLQKWKRLNNQKNRIDILNYCVDVLVNITKKNNKKITVIHLPPGNKTVEQIKKNTSFDKNYFTKLSKNNDLINYIFLEKSYKEFINYINDGQSKKIIWTDNNHPNDFGSKIIAKEVSNIIL